MNSNTIFVAFLVLVGLNISALSITSLVIDTLEYRNSIHISNCETLLEYRSQN